MFRQGSISAEILNFVSIPALIWSMAGKIHSPPPPQLLVNWDGTYPPPAGITSVVMEAVLQVSQTASAHVWCRPRPLPEQVNLQSVLERGREWVEWGGEGQTQEGMQNGVVIRASVIRVHNLWQQCMLNTNLLSDPDPPSCGNVDFCQWLSHGSWWCLPWG